MTISMPWLIRALTDDRERERIEDGIVSAVRQLYADYEGADSVIGCDPAFYRALEKITEYTDADVDELIQRAQDELTQETGRQFQRALIEDEDEDDD